VLHVNAGNVTDKIDGKWQEFWFGAGPNQEAFPCSAGCSADLDSEGLGDNNPPWTAKSTTSCLLLEVIEGYGGGEAVLEVFNNDVSLGKTSDIPLTQGSASCQTDPTTCYVDGGVTKGKFTLQKNVQHSVRIIARRSDYSGVFDGGWFRLKSVACSNPCAKAATVCTASTRCCKGLVCRSSQPRAKSRCLACARNRQFCTKNTDCCSKKCLKRTKRCVA
jgi:hypothetical protein